MNDVGWIVPVFGVGIAAGAAGATVGGGSLLSIPLLIFLGLPPQVAIATDRFAGLGAATTGFYRFWRAGKIVWRHVPVLAAASLAGSLLGARLLVGADPARLDVVVGALLLLLLPVLFLRRDLGLAPREVDGARVAVGMGLYFLVQVLAGFFGGGTGTLVFYVLIVFFGITIVQAAATQVVPFAVLTIASLSVFASRGLVDYGAGLVLLAGTALGGFLGAHLAVRGGELWVRRAFAGVVLASAVRLLWA